MGFFKKVFEKYKNDCREHEKSCKNDPYYSATCGGGIVPAPACRYCSEYNGQYCMKEVNNWDETLIIPDRDERDPYDLCENYDWSGEWEDE